MGPLFFDLKLVARDILLDNFTKTLVAMDALPNNSKPISHSM